MLWNYILPDELFLVGNHSFSKTQNGVRFFTCETIKPRNKGTWSPCHYMKVILPRHFLRKLKTAIWQPKTYKNFDYKVLANDFLEKNMLSRVEMGSHMTRTEGKITHAQKNTCVSIEFSFSFSGSCLWPVSSPSLHFSSRYFFCALFVLFLTPSPQVSRNHPSPPLLLLLVPWRYWYLPEEVCGTSSCLGRSLFKAPSSPNIPSGPGFFDVSWHAPTKPPGEKFQSNWQLCKTSET